MERTKRQVVFAAVLVVALAVGFHLKRGVATPIHGGPNGWFVLQGMGFDGNDAGQVSGGDSGQLAALGVVHFDGDGNVLGGWLTLTSAGSGGEQATCTGTLVPSTYTNQGATLVFASGCRGTLVFAWARTMGDPKSWVAAKLSLVGLGGLAMGTGGEAQAINSLVLSGDLEKQSPQP
jgi:hypothetical protein